MSVFDSYAEYYDLLYSDKDYEGEAAYVAGHVLRHLPSASSILDLGCGTGAHAERLAMRGFDVLGVDLSEAMLKRAMHRHAGLSNDIQHKVRFALGDARDFRADEPFDAVVSLFHVFSYQRTNADLLASVRNSIAHIKNDGLLLFDFWYGPAVLTQRPETRVKELENERVRVTRIAQPTLHENANVVEVNYNVFVQNKQTGDVDRIRETHAMRYLFLPEIDELLHRAGAKRLCFHEWLTDEQPSVRSWSAFVVARRAAD